MKNDKNYVIIIGQFINYCTNLQVFLKYNPSYNMITTLRFYQKYMSYFRHNSVYKLIDLIHKYI